MGTGFTEGLQVFFGEVLAKSVTRKSDNLLIVTTPDSQASSVTIEIDSADGQKARSTDPYVFDDGSSGSSKQTPPVQPQSPVDTNVINCQKSSLPLFAWACTLDSGVRLILIVVIVGSLGALIHVARSFYWYVGNRNLKSSWLLMYFLLPFTGGGLALLFYLISRGVSSAQPAGIESSRWRICCPRGISWDVLCQWPSRSSNKLRNQFSHQQKKEKIKRPLRQTLELLQSSR